MYGKKIKIIYFTHIISILKRLQTLLFLLFMCWDYQIIYVDVSFHNIIKIFKNIILHIKLKNSSYRTGLQTSCNNKYVQSWHNAEKREKLLARYSFLTIYFIDSLKTSVGPFPIGICNVFEPLN
jgi:hypothetical protein